jgi:hypothetical protein
VSLTNDSEMVLLRFRATSGRILGSTTQIAISVHDAALSELVVNKRLLPQYCVHDLRNLFTMICNFRGGVTC